MTCARTLDCVSKQMGCLVTHATVAGRTQEKDVRQQSGGVLPLNRETISLLHEKHPPASDSDGLRLQGGHIPPNPVIYEMITGEMVWKKSLQTHGSAGPSGLDARGWRRLLSSAICGSAGSDLCNALASLA